MNSLLNSFEICSKIPQNIKIIIKSFHVFNDYNNEKNIIFVTKGDKVYGLGNNSNGVLGLGHNSEVKDYTEIKELSIQKINDIVIGVDFVLGKSDDNQVFGWGMNHFGQLGRGLYSGKDEYFRPESIEFLQNTKIEDICCGFYHTLVLLSNGLLYGWGRNKESQLESDNQKFIDKPTKLSVNGASYKFKYIHCWDRSSFAITTNDMLFSWGNNGIFGILGQGVYENKCIPRVIELSNIHKICSNGVNSYFVTNEGSVYFCGKYVENGKELLQLKPKKINGVKRIRDLNYVYYSNSNEVICCDYDTSFYSISMNKSEKIEEKYYSIFELYAKRFEVTPNICNNKLNSKLSSIIGWGESGTVEKYWSCYDKKFYAIKKAQKGDFKDELLVEMKTLASIKCPLVVQYYNSRIENNQLIIQMEYCFDNLRNILSIKPKVFERNSNEAMNLIEYFISCEIFKQITEALNYLHSLEPKPLIHRDLKPENILIGKHNYKRVCKLADFGFTKFIKNHPEYHTSSVGSSRYMAPEVLAGQKYDESCDIYSLGIIGSEIFEFGNQNSNSSLEELYGNCQFYEKIKECSEIIREKMTSVTNTQRLSCNELLEVMKNCSIHKNVFRTKSKISVHSEKFKEYNLLYFKDILKSIDFSGNGIFNNIRMQNFKIKQMLGGGGFGTVAKCTSRMDNNFFAIKEIKLSDSKNKTNQNLSREVETLSKLKSHLVVQYNDCWIENDCLYIQMELCFDNLRNVLKNKRNVFERKSNEAMNSLEFFISCEIFREITEALNYLHSLKPKPVIHRDLKPENILIGNYNDTKICKLADFGISSFVENSDYYKRAAETKGYMAPEVLNGKRYDHMSDIFSLGIIGLELLELKDQSLNISELYENSGFLANIETFVKTLLKKLVINRRYQRYSCKVLLEEMKYWSLDRDIILKDPKINYFLEKFLNNNLLYFTDILNKTPSDVKVIDVDEMLHLNFKLTEIVGTGGFGTVGKYFHILEKKYYAIKVIHKSYSQNVSETILLREVKTMSELKSHFVVQYYNSWIENNSLFIQMELCFDNLRNVLVIKPKAFERNSNEAMNSIEFFISCEIFRQITEALNYLHSFKDENSLPKPLIHRDLKPENILIGNHNNKRICKLADFGLSKFTKTHSEYHTMVGATHRYRAPDIGCGHKYDIKVDIWSLGMIGLEIFNLDNEIQSKARKQFKLFKLFNESLDRKLKGFEKIITNKLLTRKRHQRISCEELLSEMNNWCLSKDTIKETLEYKTYLDMFDKTNNMFFHHLLSD